MQAKNLELSIPAFIASPKLPALDGLRAISILLVLFHHTIFSHKNTLIFKMDLGAVGVQIFFVISGFLITTLLLKERIANGNFSLKDFYIRRAFRILPLVFLFLLVLMLFNGMFSLKIPAIDFLTSLLFIGNLPIPNTDSWYTGHFWSLGVEEQFYLIFPVILFLMPTRKYLVLLLLLIPGITIVNYLHWHNTLGFFDNAMLDSLLYVASTGFGYGTVAILVGSLFSVFCFTHPIWISRLLGFQWLSLIIFSIALTLRMVFYESSSILLIFNTGIALMIISNLDSKSKLSMILDNKFISRIGVLSYSMYIWQQLFTFNQPWAVYWPWASSLVPNLAILFLVTHISYEYFEKPIIQLRQKFLSK
jgi:peptidoglycan/LPS O-acetylase OafA/YrhL